MNFGTNDNAKEQTPPPEGQPFVYIPTADTIQAALKPNIGRFVVVEFLIGTSNTVTKSGVLYEVGLNYIVLYDEAEGSYTVCDFYAIKFITFFELNRKPSTRRR